MNFQNIYFGQTRESYCDLYNERKIIFLDVRMRDGDTSKEFIEFVQGKYTKIYGFEADRHNY